MYGAWLAFGMSGVYLCVGAFLLKWSLNLQEKS
jgi:hypothetical protein